MADCVYCGITATYVLKNGKDCCKPSWNQCEAVRAKNSLGLQKAHSEGRMPYDQLSPGHGWNRGKTGYSDPRMLKLNEEIFCENSRRSTGNIKKIIMQENLLPYSCVKCGNSGTWFGEPIVLELDHVNGKNRDHRLENLRFVCPNCHTQTPTFKGRNMNRMKEMIPDALLLEAIHNEPSIQQALLSVGLTGSYNYQRVYRLLVRQLDAK
jgi:5-methylcytosine-specific restriction endonuclease McrA